MTALNLVFAGTPNFGLPILDALAESAHQLKAIYTQPDRPAGRGRQLQASAVKCWALQHHLPIYQPLNFKNQKDIDALAALAPDVLIVIAYGLILPKSVLNIPRLGCINVHASLLPRWRGASPIHQAILHGDSETGISIMKMDEGMDTGPVFCQVRCPIAPNDTAQSLHDKLAECSIKPLLETLTALTNQALPTAQNEHLVTYAPKLHKEIARIQWQNKSIEIDRCIRAFMSWPIAYTKLDETILRIHQAQLTDLDSSQKPGTILRVDKNGLLVATKDKAILLKKIQFPGGKVLSLAEWLNAGKNQLQVGLVLE